MRESERKCQREIHSLFFVCVYQVHHRRMRPTNLLPPRQFQPSETSFPQAQLCNTPHRLLATLFLRPRRTPRLTLPRGGAEPRASSVNLLLLSPLLSNRTTGNNRMMTFLCLLLRSLPFRSSGSRIPPQSLLGARGNLPQLE